MALILSGNVASALPTGYDVANSCMFNDGDSAYMHITPGSAGNRQKFTFSCWIKKCSGGTEEIFVPAADTSNYTRIGFEAGDEIKIFGVVSGSTAWEIQTQQKFRDFGAWYNIVVAFDTTQGTAADRLKLYVNGTRVPASSGFGDETYPDEDHETQVTNSVKHWLGISANGSSGPYDGYMAEVVLINDAQLTPTSFGEFDEDSPTIWKPIDVSGLTFGTNGFYLDFEASGNLGNDANGGTDLTEVNLAATDQSTDTPTNNFCTMNPLTASSYSALAEGNTQTNGTSDADNGNVISTFVPSNGKWYCESLVETGAPTGYPSVGMARSSHANFGTVLNSTVGTAGYNGGDAGVIRPDGQRFSNNSTGAWTDTTYDTDDILMMAMDCDNGAFYIGKNGTWMESGDPTSGASKTNAFLTWTPNLRVGQAFATRDYDTSVLQWNFGNPVFAISSGNADADGYGNFEYAPPSGYFALCTKNLAEYG